MCNHHLHKTVHFGFTDEVMPAGTHACLIYSNEAERQAMTIKFLSQAFQANEGVAFFTDHWDIQDIRKRLSSAGVNLKQTENSGQLALDPTSMIYYPNGYFSAEEMWERLRNMYDASIKKDYQGLRASGEMSWALKDIPGSDELIKYEAGLNQESLTRPLTAICQYDANIFSAALLMDVLRVHPYMIANNKIIKNPHFEEDFML